MPIPTASVRIGDVIAERYRIDSTLAEGGMGVLFRATDTRTHRPVVVKLLRPQDCTNDVRVQRFLRETRVTAELRHPYIVDVLDLGSDADGVPYLVLEALRGHSLQTELATRSTAMSPAEALEIALPVLEALTRVQDAGVVHRDVKPDNIFLSRNPRDQLIPKLLDFGIAKVSESNTLTQDGMVGTPMYMSPEQASAKACGPATDVWAMGAVLWHCLMGRPPFCGATTAEIGAKVLYEPVPPLQLPGVKRTFAATIERALARDLGKRYPDARTFMAILIESARDAAIPLPPLLVPDGVGASGRLVTADPSGWWSRTIRSERRGAHSWLGPGAVLAGGLLLVAFGLWWQTEPPAPVALSPVARIPELQSEVVRAPARARETPKALEVQPRADGTPSLSARIPGLDSEAKAVAPRPRRRGLVPVDSVVPPAGSAAAGTADSTASTTAGSDLKPSPPPNVNATARELPIEEDW